MRRFSVSLCVAVVAGFALTTVYQVELSGNDHVVAKKVEQEFIAVADSIGPTVSFFCGRKLVPGKYRLSIADSLGNDQAYALSDSAGLFEYCNVPATFNEKVKVLKGVKYRLVVQHSDPNCTTDFYYHDSLTTGVNAYPWGKLYVGGTSYQSRDLAAKVEGIHNVVPKEFWGINAFQGNEQDARQAASYIRELGIKLVRDDLCWNELQLDSSDRAFSRLDWRVHAYADSGLMMQAKLNYSAIWFNADSTDTFCTTGPSPDTVSRGDSLRGRGFPQFGGGCYPPMRLSGYETVDHDSVNRENWWAYYVYRIIKRFGPNSTVLPETVRIKYWEVWNEPELRGFWGHPKEYYVCHETDTIGSCHVDTNSPGQPWVSRDSMTQLYISLSRIAHEAAQQADGDAKLIGLVLSKPLCGRSSSSWEIRGLDIAKKYYDSKGDNLSDGVSFHPYQNPWPSWQRYWIFDPRELEQEIDSMRAEMAKGDGKHVGQPLWLTEWGWITKPDTAPGVTDSSQAHAITDMIFTSVGSSGRPQGGCDHISLFMLRDESCSDSMLNHWGIMTHTWTRKPGFYALKQGIAKLKNLVFNRRVATGDVGKDSLVRIYEFEDTASGKKTWVAWKNPRKLGNDATLINVAIPTCTNVDSTMRCAYDNNPPLGSITAGSDGYASINLDERPYFIYETGETLRPNLIVDSIWTSPNPPQVNNPVRVYAKIKNAGSDSTKPGIPDSVIFYVDGVKKTWVVYDSAIHENSSAIVFRDSVWTPDTTRPYLVKATVNGSRVFMELSFDNNSKYRLYNITYLPPVGSIKINNDQSFTNSPYGVLDLWSYNPNKTGSAYADYMQIWQYCIAGAETTEYSSTWIDFDPHFKWRLCQNEGKNIVYARFKITEGNLTSSDYKDSIVVDWTEAETLKMVINHDSLFTNSPTCTLCNHSVDLKSGICEMRFGNDSLVNLVKNSDMHADSFWIYHNTAFHDSLKLYVMEVQDDSNYFYQQIPKNSILAKDPDCYNGDTMRLAGDLVIDHFRGNGRLEARLIFGPQEPLAETLGVVPYGASITIPETTISKTSRYNLVSYFKFKPETTGYEFKRVDIGIFVPNTAGELDTGKIFIDNIRLEPVGSKYDFSRFENYDTTKLWTTDSVQGTRWVYAQYQDSAGNESQCIWDSIYLDITPPYSWIGSPYDSQTINGTITIYGSAYDGDGHFLRYDLDYMSSGDGLWYPVRPDSEGWTPVYGMPMWGDSLGGWWTDSVSNGWYHLRVLTQDSAHNYTSHSVVVNVSNPDPPGGDDGFGGFAGGAEGMGLDKNGNLYVISNKSSAYGNDLRIIKYSPRGESLLSFSAKLPSDSTSASWPSAIVVDDSLRILLLDGLNHCLKIFDSTGTFKLKVGSRGAKPGQFINPSGIILKDNIYIADRGNKRGQVFDRKGQFQRQFGTDSIPLKNPVSIALNKRNRTYVLDLDENQAGKIVVYDSTGKITRTVTKFNLNQPQAISLDDRDYLFIADAGNKRILELSPGLTHIYSFGKEGDSLGQFKNPTALTVTPDGRYLYVYDQGKQKIAKFNMIKPKKGGGGGGQTGEITEIVPLFLMLFAPAPNPTTRAVTIEYGVPRQEKVSLVVYDIAGREVKTVFDKIHKPGFYNATWDGKDNRDRELSAGVYFCLLKDGDRTITKKVVAVK